jgi:GNAT superfamily N-acetyltransferase
MAAIIRVRPYSGGDETSLLHVWNETMWGDRIDAATWRSRVLLDPNFVPECCAVAEGSQGIPIGFMLGLARQVPYFAQGYEREKSWITAFGVLPEHRHAGVGSALLEHVCQALQAGGAQEVAVAPYVPNYFIPGVDVAIYADAVRFLERHAFGVQSRPLSMRADIATFQVPEEIAAARVRLQAESIQVGLATAEDIVPIRQFLRRCFSWDWLRFAGEVMQDLFAGNPWTAGMLVAKQDAAVIGYAQFRAERFGPFGVDPALRSRGIGRVLLAQTLIEMRKHGYHCAWFLWTSDDAARLYQRCGFREVRRFAVMRKSLV